jgi:replicative DNA helicase
MIMAGSPDLSLLALFANRARYEKYKPYVVKKDKALMQETTEILADYEAYYKGHPSVTDIDWAAYRTWVRLIRHSDWKSSRLDTYDTLLTVIETTQKAGVDPIILDHFSRKDACDKIIQIAEKVSRGDDDDLTPIVELINQSKRDAIVSDDLSGLLGPTDISSILESRVRSGGLDWRIDTFNVAAGPIRGGDFVMLVGRPEAGKTSWLCSEISHMTRQLPEGKNAVIFNPEEGGGRVFLRLVSCALDSDLITLSANEVDTKERYEALFGSMSRIQVVEPSGGISTRQIERVLDSGNYGLVAINVLDKIKIASRSYGADKEVERYRQLAYWIREAANRYNVPILAVAQADNSAEGERYLTQGMIYGSKTGVQGEVDLLIGMGYDRTVEDRRYMSILKNKLPGGPKTDPRKKHAQFEVLFDPSTGRYKDL